MHEQTLSLKQVKVQPGTAKRVKYHSRQSVQQPQRSPLGVVLWFVAGVIFALFAYTEIRKGYFAKVYQGEVIDKWTFTTRGRHNHRTYHYIQYAYVVDGERRTDQDDIDPQTWVAAWPAMPGQPGYAVNVMVATALGTDFASYFKDTYRPATLLICLLTSASAGCFSLSLFYLCHNFAPPLPSVPWAARIQRHEDRTKGIGAISPELVGPLPRGVGFREPKKNARGYMFLAIVPFVLAGADLVVFALSLFRDQDQSVFGRVVVWIALITVSVIALAWNVCCFRVLYAVLKLWIRDRFYQRLHRWGTVVPGCIVRKWEKRGNNSADLCVECEFEHPGLGLRKIRVALKRGQYRKTDEGRKVSVLCYENRRWPTQVYELGQDFRCY
jgi:hypothetical protein